MRRLLIIEDEKLIRTSLRRIFDKYGFAVEEAENGKEGLVKWEAIQPDLVLLDWIMPIMNGKQVCTSTLAKSSDAIILVMSAYQNDTDKLNWQDYGVKGFIAKPFPNILDLVKLINRYLDDR